MIHQQSIDGETVIYLGPTALVASGSEPGAWHVVEHDSCTCESFRYRGDCRHRRVAALAAELDRLHAVAVESVSPDPVPCPSCGKRPVRSPFGKCGACTVAQAMAHLAGDDR
jgi:hypothetical protein